MLHPYGIVLCVNSLLPLLYLYGIFEPVPRELFNDPFVWKCRQAYQIDNTQTY